MNFILDQIVSWLLETSFGLLQAINVILLKGSQDIMNNDLILAFLGACQLAINTFVVVGIVMWVYKFLNIMEQGDVAIRNHFVVLLIGLIYSQSMIPGVKFIYNTGIKVVSKLGDISFVDKGLEKWNPENWDTLGSILSATGVLAIFKLIVVFLILFEFFKLFKMTIKRLPMVILHVPLGVAYLVSIFMGNLDNLITWGKSCFGVMLAYILQLAFVLMGISLLSDMANMTHFLIGLGFIFATPAVDNILGQWVTASGSSGYQQGMSRIIQTGMFMIRRR